MLILRISHSNHLSRKDNAREHSTYFTPKLADLRCAGMIFAVAVSGTCDAFLETVADSGALIDTISEPTGTKVIFDTLLVLQFLENYLKLDYYLVESFLLNSRNICCTPSLIWSLYWVLFLMKV